MTEAEGRAVQLAQREAERETRQRERERAEQQLRERQEQPGRSSSRSAQPRPSRLPPLSLAADSRRRPSSPSSSAPAAVLGGAAVSASASASLSSEVLSAEQAEEQLALIDELTDYVRSYRLPSADESEAERQRRRSARLLQPDASIVHADFFYRRQPSTALYNAFIANHALHSAVEQGLQLRERMRVDGIACDEGSYCALVQVCGSAGPECGEKERQRLAAQALQLLHEMETAGIRPSLRFFNCLLSAFIRLQCCSRALSVPELLRARGLQPDKATLSSLLGLYRQLSVPQLQAVWSGITQPDVVAYDAMLRAAAHHGEAELALRLQAEMRAAGLQLTAFSYNSLLLACARRPDFYLRCFELYEQAVAERLQPDRRMLSILIHACAVNADLGNAVRVFQQMERLGVGRDTAACNSLMAAIAASQRFPQYEMPGAPAASRALSQSDRMLMAERLLTQMEASSVPVDERSVYLALKVVTAALRLRRAEERRLELIARYVPGDEERQRRDGSGEFSARLWLLLLRMYCRARRARDCRRVMDAMEARGLSIPQSGFDWMLRVCAVTREEQLGADCLRRMRELNLRPSRAEDERLFDPELYRAWLRQERQRKGDGAVQPMPEQQRSRLREQAALTARGGRRSSSSKPKPAAAEARSVWRPSRAERRSRDRQQRTVKDRLKLRRAEQLS